MHLCFPYPFSRRKVTAYLTHNPAWRVHKPKGMRHTNASLLIAQGADVRTVAGLLGHASPGTTLDIYAHAFDKTKREAQEKLGKVMGL